MTVLEELRYIGDFEKSYFVSHCGFLFCKTDLCMKMIKMFADVLNS